MLTVKPIQAFKDNYIWMLVDAGGRYAALVDPGDAEPVTRALRAGGLTPVAILLTHHHWDHTGGVSALLQDYPGLSVYGPATERFTNVTHPLREDDRVELSALNARFRVLEVPGHTLDHIAYYGEGALFCGDTLFSVGCGRLFEGTAEQMHSSLSKIIALPGDTLVYCAHEYTLDNIAFAKWVEPRNPDLLRREEEAAGLRRRNLPTVPSRLDVERRTNPFLRFDEPTVIQAASVFAERTLTAGAEVFGTVRYWKDSRFD